MTLVVVMSILIVCVLCALVFFSLRGNSANDSQTGAVTTSSDLGQSSSLASVDPISVFTKLSTSLVVENDADKINQLIVQLYPSTSQEFSQLRATLKYNTQLGEGLARVQAALDQQYADATKHRSPSTVTNDYGNLEQLAQSYLILLQAQENSP